MVVGDAAGANEDHTIGSVVVLDVVCELRLCDIADVFAGTKDGASQGLMLEGGGVEVIEHNLLNLLLDLLGLSQDDITFAFNGVFFEL